eukprot:scaffold3474_cov246-Pinguiococcus_pyrenoidosus.AAC.9
MVRMPTRVASTRCDRFLCLFLFLTLFCVVHGPADTPSYLALEERGGAGTGPSYSYLSTSVFLSWLISGTAVLVATALVELGLCSTGGPFFWFRIGTVLLLSVRFMLDTDSLGDARLSSELPPARTFSDVALGR